MSYYFADMDTYCSTLEEAVTLVMARVPGGEVKIWDCPSRGRQVNCQGSNGKYIRMSKHEGDVSELTEY